MPFIYEVKFGPDGDDTVTDKVIVTMPTMNAGLALLEAQKVALADAVKGVTLLEVLPED